MTTNLTRRRCNGKTCVAFLSSYNNDPDGLCGPCRKTQTDEWITRLREQMDYRDPDKVPETRAGSQMWRVLRAMPASGREIAERTGIPLDKVRVTARDAIQDGRAARRKRPREGSHGETSEYVCLVELPPPTGAAGKAKYTRESLIESLHQMKRYLGRAPIAEDCGMPWPSRSTFDRHFKTWADALAAAGIRAKGNPRKELTALLAEGPATSSELAKRLGRTANAVTSNLADMYHAGLATREWIPSGRRYVYTLVKQDGA